MFPSWVTAPCVPVVSKAETVSTSSVSGSESSVPVVSTLMPTGESSSVVTASSTAVGAAFRPVMVTVTVATAEPPLPSTTV